MILEKPPKEFSLPSERMQRDVYDQHVHENIKSTGSGNRGPIVQNENFFIAKVRPFELLDFISPAPTQTVLLKRE